MSYGGILPYAIKDGKVLLLLGREVHIPGWDGSNLWAPFGGGVDPGESVYAAALREGYEETMGMFGSVAELRKRVGRGAHTRWKHGRNMTLLMRVEHHRALPRLFRNFYLYSRRCRSQACPEGWYEKTRIKWVPLSRLSDTDPRLRPEFRRTLKSLRLHFRRHRRELAG